jgi:hypothetical protein
VKLNTMILIHIPEREERGKQQKTKQTPTTTKTLERVLEK